MFFIDVLKAEEYAETLIRGEELLEDVYFRLEDPDADEADDRKSCERIPLAALVWRRGQELVDGDNDWPADFPDHAV